MMQSVELDSFVEERKDELDTFIRTKPIVRDTIVFDNNWEYPQLLIVPKEYEYEFCDIVNRTFYDKSRVSISRKLEDYLLQFRKSKISIAFGKDLIFKRHNCDELYGISGMTFEVKSNNVTLYSAGYGPIS